MQPLPGAGPVGRLVARLARFPAAQTIAASLTLQAVVLVSGVLATRMLGPTDRGHLAIFWATALGLTQLGTLGLPSAITFAMAKEGWGLGQLYQALRWRLFAMFGGLTAAQLVIMVVWFQGGSVQRAALVSVLAVPAVMLQMFGIASLQGAQLFVRMNIARIVPFASYTVALIAEYAVGADSLLAVTLAWTLTSVLGAIVTLALAARTWRARGSTAGRIASGRALSAFGRRALFGAVSPTETFRADQLLVGLILAPAALGLYVAALAFTNLPRFIAASIGLVAYPRIAELDDQVDRRRAIWRYTATGTVMAALVVLPMLLFAGTLMELFFGKAFEPATAALRILLVGSLFLASRRVLTDALRGAGQPQAGSVAELISWGTLVPALIVGAHLDGLEGVAWALCFAYVVSWLVLWVFSERARLGIFRVPAPKEAR